MINYTKILHDAKYATSIQKDVSIEKVHPSSVKSFKDLVLAIKTKLKYDAFEQLDIQN